MPVCIRHFSNLIHREISPLPGDLSLVSTERYSSVWYGTVLLPLDLACVSTADCNLIWWGGYMPDAFV